MARSSQQQQPPQTPHEALFLLWVMMCHLFESLHPDCVEDSVEQDLGGLKQCVLQGPNEEQTIDYNTPDYYARWNWKKHSMMLMDAVKSQTTAAVTGARAGKAAKKSNKENPRQEDEKEQEHNSHIKVAEDSGEQDKEKSLVQFKEAAMKSYIGMARQYLQVLKRL